MATTNPETLLEAKDTKKKALAAGFQLEKVLQSPAFVPGVVVFLGLVLLFWPMVSFLPKLWLSDDGYYSHGFLVPALSALTTYLWWPRLKQIPVKPSYIALPFLLACVYMAFIAYKTDIDVVSSFTLIGTILCSIWFVAGFRWMLGLMLPVGYLLFALPIFTMAINTYTNDLQQASTEVSYQLLSVMGLDPLRYDTDPTTIFLNNFVLNIAVPCSGLKLLLALMAFTGFFMMIAKFKIWQNALMFLLIFPLGVFINGLRIALIGVVGNQWGSDAGMQFHDYSGYITLLICFFILFKISNALGWQGIQWNQSENAS